MFVIKDKFKLYTLHVILPLVLGIMIYLFIRPNPTIAENIINWKYQPSTQLYEYTLIKILAGSLPDFFWLYAFLSMLYFIWGGYKNIPFYLLFITYSLPILTEILQYFNIIFGTGDFFDILAYIIAIILNKYLLINYQNL